MKNNGPRYLLLAGILLIFVGLILYRPVRLNFNWSIDVKDWLHWIGIIAALILSSTSVLALSRFRRSFSDWLKIHCVLSAFSFGLALVHSRTKGGVILPIHYHSYLTLLLSFLLVISGVLTQLYPGNLIVSKYLRAYHLPISIGFYVTLFYHILVKLGLLR